MTDLPEKKPRGFAAMDPALRRELSRRGGKAAHVKGTAHRFTSEEARVAGSRGGKVAQAKIRADREANDAVRAAAANAKESM